jgi:hypothetical protein
MVERYNGHVADQFKRTRLTRPKELGDGLDAYSATCSKSRTVCSARSHRTKP